MSRKVIFSPDPPTTHSSKHGGNRKKPILKIWIFRFPKGSSSRRFSVGSFIANVAKSLPLISTPRRKCSGKVSSLGRSRSYAETVHDSQRAEAIEDCIEFLNSSSSSSSCLQRSNSVSRSC